MCETMCGLATVTLSQTDTSPGRRGESMRQKLVDADATPHKRSARRPYRGAMPVIGVAPSNFFPVPAAKAGLLPRRHFLPFNLRPAACEWPGGFVRGKGCR